jgi:hypothetical protein
MRCSLLQALDMGSCIQLQVPSSYILSDIFRHGCKEEEDIAQELFLHSDSDTHALEDEILPHESDIDQEETKTETHNGLAVHSLDMVYL